MTKPVLLVDTNFLIHIYGQAPDGAPRGQNYDPKMGEAILDDLSKKYDIRVTSTVLDEATVLPEFREIRNWFDRNKGTKAVIYDTPTFGGKNGGENSIMDVIQRTADRDPTLPPAGDTANLKIASIDKLLKKSALKDHVMSTQQVAEAALVDGTLSRENYDLLGQKTGDIFRTRGGFKTSAEVYAEHGITPPPAPQAAPPAPQPEKPPMPETPTVQPPAPETTAQAQAPAPKSPLPAMQDGSLVESAGRNSKFAGSLETHPSPGNVAAPGVGIVLGTVGLHDAIKHGDKVEGVIAGVNLTTSSVQTAEVVLDATGKALPALAKAGKFVPGLNVAATVADGAYQISKEDTVEHKAERAAVVGATAATALTVGTATATAGEAAVITGGVTAALGTGAVGATVAAAAVAAAPVVLAVAAAGAVAYVGEKAIEAKRAWDNVDKQIAEDGKAEKRQNYTSPDGKPSVLGYKHIAPAMLHVSDQMKNENMNGTSGLERDKNGRLKIGDFNKIDMRDPKNIAELERVLTSEIAKDDKIVKDNDSFVPKGWRFFSQDAVDKMTNAQRDEANLKGAMQELQMYKKELADYDKAHPDSPATTQPPVAKPKAKGPQQS